MQIDGKKAAWDLKPVPDNSVLGELNFATSNGSTDLYVARFTAYKRKEGGELEISLHNTETNTDYAYYFDPEGFFGFRFNDSNEFVINVDQDNDRTVLKTTKGRIRFETGDGIYDYMGPDYGSPLRLQVDSSIVGLTTGASTDDGEYGIHHEAAKTVSLKNTEVKFASPRMVQVPSLKESDTVTIIPGGTSVSSSAGTINKKLIQPLLQITQ